MWGTGIVEGVAAPESANNAVSGPTMIPLLTLGIPGSTIAAILIGVFLIHGIQVGPTIFATSKELVSHTQNKLFTSKELVFHTQNKLFTSKELVCSYPKQALY